ncbi:MAG: hypothetical protein IKU24_03145 [Clostridia bacterium]|nr:hypothetical protein [Clostridia bacterium]
MADKKENPHAGHRAKLKKRFLLQGIEGFEDHNILELILFFAIPRRDTNVIAHNLLNKFGSFSRVFEASVDELCEVEGIGRHAAELIKTYPAVAKRYYRDRFKEEKKLPQYHNLGQELVLEFAGVDHEQVLALFYDNSLGFRGQVVLHEGDINSVAFSFRKVCDATLQHNAAFVIIAHNHPHGLPIASAEDLSTTSRLQKFLAQMNVTLIDHFIIAEGHFSSIQKSAFYTVFQTIKVKNETFQERKSEK